MITLAEMLQKLIQAGGSDLHLTIGTPPQVRVDGKLRPLDMPPLDRGGHEAARLQRHDRQQKHAFEEKWEYDFSFGIKDLCRFRANVFTQRGAVAAVFRAIPFEIKSFEALGLPGRGGRALRQAARPHSGHRADRERQIDHAGRHDRQDQPRAPRAHPDHRRPDRVPPLAQELHRQPARGEQRHALIRGCPARRAARRPGRGAHR